LPPYMLMELDNLDRLYYTMYML